MARTVVLLGALIAAVVVAAKASELQAKPELTGLYLCEGKNPDGSPYHGLVEIAAVENTYLVRWTMQDGEQVIGVGLVNGDTLAVSYFGGSPAIAMYRKDGEERLVGEWTMGGAEGMAFAETLTRIHVIEQKPAPTRLRPGREL